MNGETVTFMLYSVCVDIVQWVVYIFV